MAQILSSPNRLVWAYASAARTLAFEARMAGSLNESREKACAALTMSVACVETYLNVFAQIWLSQVPEFEHREKIEADLRNKKSLGRKLEEWPSLFFNSRVEFGSGPGQKFKACLDHRNRLMHFSSDSHTFKYDNVVLNGLVDTSAFEELTAEVCSAYVRAAENFIEYLIRLQGIPESQIPNAVHGWLGQPPVVRSDT
jgi:hypothetical protein